MCLLVYLDAAYGFAHCDQVRGHIGVDLADVSRTLRHSVDLPKPRLVDRREDFKSLSTKASDPDTAADRILDEVWRMDHGRWQRRLKPFLDRMRNP